jgi:hypothetical protein
LKAFIPYEETEGLFLDYSSSSSSEASAGEDILNTIGSTESAFSKEEDAPEKLTMNPSIIDINPLSSLQLKNIAGIKNQISYHGYVLSFDSLNNFINFIDCLIIFDHLILHPRAIIPPSSFLSLS